MRKKKYEKRNGYIVGRTLNGGKFYIDAEDYELVKRFDWYMETKGYIIAQDDNKRCVRMHRLIIKPPQDMQVDHINHVRHDNRKSNLRICTASENIKNRKPKNEGKEFEEILDFVVNL